MATVPGQPIQDATGGIPAELQPGPEHLLMAAAIVQQQGRFAPQVASRGDFKDYIKTPRSDDPDYQDWLRKQQHDKEQPPEKTPGPTFREEELTS
jgi:hypothetical protein